MHFRTILFVDLPEVEPDPVREQTVLEQIKERKAALPVKPFRSALSDWLIGKLVNIKTNFGFKLSEVVYETMERFYCETKEPRYLEFEDKTEKYINDFEEEVDCVVLPNGKIVEADLFPVWPKFIVKDGLVFQKAAGQLKQPKRTKKAKKMKALPNYPRKKLYVSFEAFVEACGGRKNEETGQYGEFYNPNSVFDFCSIGGRWPAMFLVKTDCTEYSYGERASIDESDFPAPDGYRWVAAARKKDIQWDAMRQWRNQKAKERFFCLEMMFQAGQTDEPYTHISECGIYSLGKLIYQPGDTLEEYMTKHGIPETWEYPIDIYGLFANNSYHDKSDSFYDEAQKKWVSIDWQATMSKHINDAEENTVFVGIDYHI